MGSYRPGIWTSPGPDHNPALFIETPGGDVWKAVVHEYEGTWHVRGPNPDDATHYADGEVTNDDPEVKTPDVKGRVAVAKKRARAYIMAQIQEPGAAPWRHWRVAFMRRGMEPPRPFGKTSRVVCATNRKEAIAAVGTEASPGHPITASRVDERERVTHPHRCHHPTLIASPEAPAATPMTPASPTPTPTPREIEEDVRRIRASASGPTEAPQLTGYRVAYLVPNPRRGQPGEETMLRLWWTGEGVIRTMTEAMTYLSAAKRRGLTAWITDEAGHHVPVKGALRPPGLHSIGS